MSLKKDIAAKIIESMKAKDPAVVGCLRLVMAAIKNREIDKREELTEAECIKVLSTLAKQRGESIEMYTNGGRDELAAKESEELSIIKSFLPEELSESAMEKLVDEAIAEVGASSMKEMGKVMKVLAPKVAGRADGKVLSEMVKARLAG
jgi:uncharacterized protein